MSLPADDVRLRLATPDDAATLALLAARLFAQAFAADNAPDDLAQHLAGYTAASQRAALEAPDARVWLAEAPGADAPVGYAHLRAGEAPACVPLARPAEVARLYVDAAWHGRGLAARLMAACVDEAAARGCDGVWLGVWQRNPRAIAFYERQGFRRVGTQTFVVGSDPQTDWVMVRPVATTRDG